MVTHKGRDADGGHYVSWVHMKEDEWVQNDDDVVKAATKEEILQLKGGGDWHIAYLCFYRKLQVIPDDQ